MSADAVIMSATAGRSSVGGSERRALSTGLRGLELQKKGRPGAGGTFRPDSSPNLSGRALSDRESHSGTSRELSIVKSLEGAEEFVCQLRVESNSVIPEEKLLMPLISPHAHFD